MFVFEKITRIRLITRLSRIANIKFKVSNVKSRQDLDDHESNHSKNNKILRDNNVAGKQKKTPDNWIEEKDELDDLMQQNFRITEAPGNDISSNGSSRKQDTGSPSVFKSASWISDSELIFSLNNQVGALVRALRLFQVSYQSQHTYT